MTVTTEDRFWSHVHVGGVCWEWELSCNKDGYGRFAVTTLQQAAAHRWAWENLVGPIPEGMELDHLCRNRRCVNPDHLEPVTHAENVRRGRVKYSNRDRQVVKTHCKNGHEYTEENTYLFKGKRYCRTCRAAAARNKRRRDSRG